MNNQLKNVEYARKRLVEKVNIRCNLAFKLKFAYCSTLENGFVEKEIDFVVILDQQLS